MNESFYAKVNRLLSWKMVIGFNLLLLVALAIPLSVNLTQKKSLDNRSNAANDTIPSATPIPNYPKQPPTIDRVTLFYGKPGDTVVILGKNFGAYPWNKSKLYVGNVGVSKQNIIKWSDKIIEASIPEGAVTGKVWLRINGRTAVWPGTLLIYNPNSGQIGLSKQGSTGLLWLQGASRVKRGTIELGFTGGVVQVQALPQVKIEKQLTSVDNFGNKLKLDFSLNAPLTNAKTPLFRFEKSNGQVEILSAVLKNGAGQTLSFFSSPLNLKINF